MIVMLSFSYLNRADCLFFILFSVPGEEIEQCQFTFFLFPGRQNISGTFTALINVISLMLAPNARTSAIYYFITALFVLLACFDSFFALPLNVIDFVGILDCYIVRFSYVDVFLRRDSTATMTNAFSDKRKRGTQRPAGPASGVLLTGPSSRSASRSVSMSSSSSLLRWASSRPSTLVRSVLTFIFINSCCYIRPYTRHFWPRLFSLTRPDVKMSDPDFLIPERYFIAVCCFLSFNFFAMIGNMLPNLFTWVGRLLSYNVASQSLYYN